MTFGALGAFERVTYALDRFSGTDLDEKISGLA
jgi:hypothetical protein